MVGISVYFGYDVVFIVISSGIVLAILGLVECIMSSLVFNELMELYVDSDSSTELEDCVEGRHKRRN